MCGIGILISPEKDKRKKLDVLGNLLINSLKSRGPNENGLWIDKNGKICMVHTRLSIQGLDKYSSQPMLSSNCNWVISFNGEIYNKKLLRSHINTNRNDFYKFQGNSDTEILIEYIQEFGIEATLNEIEGMFSIIAYNQSNSKLYICGDKFGEKPLYFGNIEINKKKYFFACSDLNSIKSIGGRNLKYDESSIFELLHRGYVSAPRTIYEEMNKLFQANFIEYSFCSNFEDFKITRNEIYWDHKKFNQKDIISKCNDMSKFTHVIDELITNAVSLRLESDVPIACSLSSGVDSTIISAKANRLTNNNTKCFSLGFIDSQNNELYLAKKNAKELGFDHSCLEISMQESLNYFEKSLSSMTEPIGDSSILPTYILSNYIAGEGFKVALGGDGADEIFGGYRRHILTSCFMDFGLKFFQYPSKFVSNNLSDNSKLTRLIEIISSSNSNENYYQSITCFLKKNKLIKFFKNKNLSIPFSGFFEKESLYISNLLLDQKHFLHNDILRKTDSASMANSLEMRSPFLDSRIYQYGSFINRNSKTSKRLGKLILRSILDKALKGKYNNSKKLGFGAPLNILLINRSKKDFLAKYLSIICDELDYIFDIEMIKKLFNEFREKQNYGYLVFTLCAFANWHENNASILRNK